MRINQVVIIESVCPKKARYSEKITEYDAMKSYSETLAEFLEHDRISAVVAKPNEVLIEPNTLLVVCGSGWIEKPCESNHSVVFHNSKEAGKFAKIVRETLGDWGKCYVDFKHQAKEKQQKKPSQLDRTDILAIEVHPFAANGPNAEDYVKRAPKLGEMLAQAIFEYLRSRNEHPRMMNTYRTV